MTVSELVLRRIASQLAIMVALCLLGRLPDHRYQLPIAQANAIEMDAAYLQAPRVEYRTNETVGRTD